MAIDLVIVKIMRVNTYERLKRTASQLQVLNKFPFLFSMFSTKPLYEIICLDIA